MDQVVNLPDPPTPTLELQARVVAGAVAEVVGITVESLYSRDRRWRIAHARQIAMYVLAKMSGETYEKVGATFGRNHTTAMFADRKVQARLRFDEATRACVDKVLIDVAAPELLKEML